MKIDYINVFPFFVHKTILATRRKCLVVIPARFAFKKYGHVFYVHRTVGSQFGYSVSEYITGMRVPIEWHTVSPGEAIRDAQTRLNQVGRKKFLEAFRKGLKILEDL